MAKNDTKITVTIKIEPQLSWSDALKLRLAGGKSAQVFWDKMVASVSEVGK